VAEDVFGIVGSLQAGVFRVERVVAEGGFGVVYRAFHEGFRAAVALKCLKIPRSLTAEQQSDFLAKFQAEGEVLFRLSALIPAVVRPLHVGSLQTSKHPFVPFIALEWLDGESLDSLVSRRKHAGKPPLDLNRAVRLLGPVARALECAHRFPGSDGSVLSILHRDLKPENLFLAKVHGQETIKILDFGIGKVRSAATQMVGRVSAEQGGIAAFTPAYGAPEQWLPKRYGQTGPWTDVWGLALCAVEVLTGAPPLDGDAPAIMGACIDETERPTPRALGASVPDRVEAAFRKALAVDPVQRYQEVGQFWDELEAAAGVHTPRIKLGSAVDQESIPPPPEATQAPVSSLLSIGEHATQALPESPQIPDLALAPAPSRKAPRAAAAPPVASAGFDEDDFEALPQLSLVGSERAEHQRLARSSGPELALGVAPAAARVARTANVRALPSEPPSMQNVARRVLPALRFIGLSLLVMLADFAYALATGENFALGPARALWIAAPLLGFGLLKLVLSLAG
jgi:serine/threonine-protein kinase